MAHRELPPLDQQFQMKALKRENTFVVSGIGLDSALKTSPQTVLTSPVKVPLLPSPSRLRPLRSQHQLSPQASDLSGLLTSRSVLPPIFASQPHSPHFDSPGSPRLARKSPERDSPLRQGQTFERSPLKEGLSTEETAHLSPRPRQLPPLSSTSFSGEQSPHNDTFLPRVKRENSFQKPQVDSMPHHQIFVQGHHGPLYLEDEPLSPTKPDQEGGKRQVTFGTPPLSRKKMPHRSILKTAPPSTDPPSTEKLSHAVQKARVLGRLNQKHSLDQSTRIPHPPQGSPKFKRMVLLGQSVQRQVNAPLDAIPTEDQFTKSNSKKRADILRRLSKEITQLEETLDTGLSQSQRERFHLLKERVEMFELIEFEENERNSQRS